MTDKRKCDQCGAVLWSWDMRILNTPEGRIDLCATCRRKREWAYKEADSIHRNEASRIKYKLIKERGKFCQQCGRKPDRIHGHHIKPLRLGGQNTPDNLLLLCAECHRLEHVAGTRY